MKNVKKILALALVIISVLAISIPALAASTMYGKCTVGQYINVRSASSGGSSIYRLRNGEPVTYTGTTKNGRYQISAPVSGWVQTDYLSSNTPAWMSRYGSKTMNLATRDQMIAFQTDLNKISGISITVDGYWGTQTQEAVKTAQSKAGITVDGIAGTYTKLWVYDLANR